MRPTCCTKARSFLRGANTARTRKRGSSIPSMSLNWWTQKCGSPTTSRRGTRDTRCGSASPENLSWTPMTVLPPGIQLVRERLNVRLRRATDDDPGIRERSTFGLQHCEQPVDELGARAPRALDEPDR